MATISQTNYNTFYNIGVSQNYRIGQTFYNNSGETHIDKITLRMNKNRTPSGTLTFAFYAVDGNNYPTGNPLKTISVSSITIPASDTPVDWIIDLDINNNTTYAFVLYETYSSSKYSGAAVDNTSPVYTGGRIIYTYDNGSTWEHSTSEDFYFIVTLSSGGSSKFFQLF